MVNPTENGALDHLRKIFVGGLAIQTTVESLQSFFGQFGEVVDAVVMRDPDTLRSRCFGFVSFNDSTVVDKVQDARPHIIDGKTVDTKRAQPRGELTKTEGGTTGRVKKIFIGGLKDCHDEDVLGQYFSQFGNVASIKVLTDKGTGRKRGFGFLEFDDADAVERATEQSKHTIAYTLVEVKKCIYKPDPNKRFNGQPMGMPNGQHDYKSNTGGYNNGYGGYQNHHQTPVASGYDNSWAGYAPAPAANGYGQPQAVGAYDPYGAAAAAGAPPMNGGWHTNVYAAPQPAYANGWTQSGYNTASAPSAGGAGSGVSASSQQFGEYKQAYNGGPQKASYLQSKRMNPYNSGMAAPNYEFQEL